MTTPDVVLRAAMPSDAVVVAALLTELGHATVGRMVARAAFQWAEERGCSRLAELEALRDGWELRGVALLAHEGQPCRLDYRIGCDTEWRTRTVRVHGQIGARPVMRELTCSPDGEWVADGWPVAASRNCIDVDLGFSPSTNLLPIRWLKLAIGARAEVSASWGAFRRWRSRCWSRCIRASRPTAIATRAPGARSVGTSPSTVRDGVTEYPDFWRADAMTAARPTDSGA